MLRPAVAGHIFMWAILEMKLPFYQAMSFRAVAASNPGLLLRPEIFGIYRVSFQKHPRNGDKQKITVVEIVSTTVTDLVPMEITDLKTHLLN